MVTDFPVSTSLLTGSGLVSSLTGEKLNVGLSFSLDDTNEESDSDSSDSNESSKDIQYETEIIEIYKEVPGIFDEEALQKYLDEGGYSEEDLIGALCENI